MMNIKQNKGLFALLLLAVLTACTSEDNITTSKQLIEVGGDKLKIVINEEPFDVETTAQTRAGGVAQAIPAGTVDLGDGLEAEVSISQGTPAPKTRATVVSDGHYNIYAYDANTNQMLVGKKLSGNVVGGVFTPDAGSRLELEAGTYRFVCCTDGVSLDPTYGTGSIITPNINIKKEMIGATAPITLSGDDQQIVFLMYHREARVRFRITGYTNQLTNVQLVMDFGSTSNHYHYLTIPTGFQGPGTAMMGLVSDTYTMPSTRTQASVTYPLANEFLSDYKYLSWDENPWSGINLKISGTIYGKTVSKTVYCRFDHNTVLKDNGTYTINLKLKPTPALYLFQDGSCGALAEKGTRTPIAAVVKEKTNTEEGTAIALHRAFDFAMTPDGAFNKQSLSVADAMNDMNGYNYTWDAATTVDNEVKATAPNPAGLSTPSGYRYEPFYYAGNYNPGVATSNIGKWYLPALGEWRMAIKEFAGVDIAVQTSLYDTYANWDRQKMKKVFALAGGDIDTDWGSGYWESSTQYNDFQQSLYVLVNDGFVGVSSDTFNSHGVVPFVHF
ncbi:hypothetical protein [Prevotella sp. HJM029]|uniref:hypothetical protein n=1 Tax=Prevotella sp. HJM029 TaxID=1433844 RepID=UPI00048BCCDE|nr:hypothetical protein [Prevotella sp. HJM029]